MRRHICPLPLIEEWHSYLENLVQEKKCSQSSAYGYWSTSIRLVHFIMHNLKIAEDRKNKRLFWERRDSRNPEDVLFQNLCHASGGQVRDFLASCVGSVKKETLFSLSSDLRFFYRWLHETGRTTLSPEQVETPLQHPEVLATLPLFEAYLAAKKFTKSGQRNYRRYFREFFRCVAYERGISLNAKNENDALMTLIRARGDSLSDGDYKRLCTKTVSGLICLNAEIAVEMYVDYLAEDPDSSTARIKQPLSAVRGFYRWIHERGLTQTLCEVNTPEGLEPMQAPPDYPLMQRRHLLPFPSLVDFLRERNRALDVLLQNESFALGLSHLLALRFSGFDFEDKLVRVVTPDGRKKVARIDHITASIVRSYFRLRHYCPGLSEESRLDPFAPLFISADGGILVVDNSRDGESFEPSLYDARDTALTTLAKREKIPFTALVRLVRSDVLSEKGKIILGGTDGSSRALSLSSESILALRQWETEVLPTQLYAKWARDSRRAPYFMASDSLTLTADEPI